MKNRIVEMLHVKPSDLRANPDNWRTHPATQKAALGELLAQVGVVAPLVLNKRSPAQGWPEGEEPTLVDGHLRQDLAGEEPMPVVVVDLSPDEERLVLTTLDPVGAMAEASKKKLRELIEAVRENSSDGVRELLAQIEARNNLATEPQPKHANPGDELESKWQTELGQLWRIGPHLLLCGDATDKAQVQWLVAKGGLAGLLVTDPPYGVQYDPQWRNEADGLNRRAPGRAQGDKLQGDSCADWAAALAHFAGDVAYVWFSSLDVVDVAQGLDGLGLQRRSLIIWRKQTPTISRGHYHWQHEPCWYAVRKGATAGWVGDRKQTTVWDINTPQGYTRYGEADTGHATQKPVECMARPIRNHRHPVVFDPFVGSGTTIVAAHELGRRCLAIEIDPGHVARCLQRLADLGLKPELS